MLPLLATSVTASRSLRRLLTATPSQVISCHAAKRCISSHAAFHLLSWFSDMPPALLVERGLLAAHGVSGHWTFELLTCTAAARILISTATMTYNRKLFTTYALTTHPVNQQERKVRSQAEQLAAGSLPPLLVRDIKLKEVARLRKISQNLIEEKNIHPAKGFIVIGVEALFWLSYAVAVRNIVAGFPQEWTDTARTDMQSQGLLWFTDLTQPDPFYILPIMACSTLIFSINMMAEWRYQNGIPEIRFLKIIRYAALPLSGWMFYWLHAWPCAISLYMSMSLLIGVGQAYAFTHPAVQRLLRIPQVAGHTPVPVSFKQWMQNLGFRVGNRRNPL